MDGLRRITFRFGTQLEIRYLPRTPQPGDLVSRGQDLWEVRFVSADNVGMTIICERHDGDDREARRVA